MSTDGARVVQAFKTTWSTLATHANPAVWYRDVPGALALVSELEVPTLNGVWVFDDDVAVETVMRLVDGVRHRGFPFCLQTRASDRNRMSEVASDLGMTPFEQVPLMVLDDLGALTRQRDSLLVVRQLSEEDLDVHAEVAAEGFGAPIQLFRDMMGRFGGVPGLSVFVGEVEGTPVTTAVGVRGKDRSVGVFNVATRPEKRRHGYGAEITSEVLRAAGAAGASWAWLQSSLEGLSIYHGIGFHEVERWPTWVQTEI